MKREYRSDSEEERPRKKRSYNKSSKAAKGKAEKGKPRWTAYLLWSTRKRRDVVVDHPDWTFAEIAKWISEEWKKIEADEKDELQKEAEEMNELGIRKLPRDDDGRSPDPDRNTTDDDSDFEEGYRKKNKPIMLKIKKEAGEGAEGGGGEDEAGSDESDWEPEAELSVGQRESRSGRQRKRPSFFQEFESQENNLDHILQEFEETQAKEFGKPRLPKVEKPPGEKRPRKPRKPRAETEVMADEDVEVETEVLRSGRKRNVRKRVMASFLDEEEEEAGGGASSDDDDFEPPAEEEMEKIETKDDEIEESDEHDEFDEDDEEDYDDIGPKRDHALPIKKRGRPKKILTDAEIEEATRAALGTRPVIEIIPVPPKLKVGERELGEVVPGEAGENGEADNGAEEDEGEETSKEPEVFKPFFVPYTADDEEDDNDKNDDDGGNPLGDDAGGNPLGDDDAGGPLDDDPLNSEAAANPLDQEDEQEQTHNVPMNEEDALLATVSMDTAEQAAPTEENPLGNDEERLPEVEASALATADTMAAMAGGTKQVNMSEEDLLTGPAHNLDDSQYKADYADPNLDDIFK